MYGTILKEHKTIARNWFYDKNMTVFILINDFEILTMVQVSASNNN